MTGVRHSASPALRRARASQRGSATVLAVAMLVLLGVVAAVAVGLGGLLVAKRQAAAAADLAALAGAAALQRGEVGCDAAAATATANQAQVVNCRQDGDVVDLEVSVRASSLPGVEVVSARARAGPG